MGTAQYLSPEQAQGKETTPRSDIYSIGVILYEALTGRVPFEGDSAVAVALKQVSETPRRPSAINPSVPPALDAVVMRALAKDPEARFNDADAFLKALDAAERAPDQPRPEDTAAFAAVSPEGEHEDADEDEEDWRGRGAPPAAAALDPPGAAGRGGGRPGRLRAHPARPGGGPDRDRHRDVGTATELLENEGLDVDIDPRPSTRRRDTVLEQDPIAGEKVDEGSTVTLTVSSGPAIVTGARRQRADPRRRRPKLLEEAGLLVDPGFGFSDTVPEGRAIGTEPGAGTDDLRGLDREADDLARLQQGRGAGRGRARRPAGALDPERRRAGRERRPARRRRARPARSSARAPAPAAWSSAARR